MFCERKTKLAWVLRLSSWLCGHTPNNFEGGGRGDLRLCSVHQNKDIFTSPLSLYVYFEHERFTWHGLIWWSWKCVTIVVFLPTIKVITAISNNTVVFTASNLVIACGLNVKNCQFSFRFLVFLRTWYVVVGEVVFPFRFLADDLPRVFLLLEVGNFWDILVQIILRFL